MSVSSIAARTLRKIAELTIGALNKSSCIRKTVSPGHCTAHAQQGAGNHHCHGDWLPRMQSQAREEGRKANSGEGRKEDIRKLGLG
eukprot:1846453-Rhodomonas_salina.2